MKYLLIIVIPIQFLLGQDLKGKWVRIDDDYTFSTPQNIVIEITKRELITYSFDSLFSKTKLKIDTKNKLLKKGKKEHYLETKYQIIDSIYLIEYEKLHIHSEKGLTTKTTEATYAKLLPTSINYPLDSILNKNYKHFYGSNFMRPHDNIKFNELMCSDQVKRMIGEDNCPRYKLKKIDQTYFIIYYAEKEFGMWMVPIKEINKDHLIVYGLHGQEGFIRINEIKEIAPQQKVFFDN